MLYLVSKGQQLEQWQESLSRLTQLKTKVKDYNDLDKKKLDDDAIRGEFKKILKGGGTIKERADKFKEVMLKKFNMDPKDAAKELAKNLYGLTGEGLNDIKEEDVHKAVGKILEEETLLKSDDEYTKFVLGNSNDEKEKILKFI